MWRAKVWKDNRGDSNKTGPTSLECGKIQQLAGILDINLIFDLTISNIPVSDSSGVDSCRLIQGPAESIFSISDTGDLVLTAWQDILGDEKWVSLTAPHLQRLKTQRRKKGSLGHWSAKYERMDRNAKEQCPLLWFWLQRSYMNFRRFFVSFDVLLGQA